MLPVAFALDASFAFEKQPLSSTQRLLLGFSARSESQPETEPTNEGALSMAHGAAADPVEMGRQGGIKSGETRRAKAQTRKDLQARQKFADASIEVAQELLDAALGKGKWQLDGQPQLDAKDRVAILKTCLEYGVGRPRPQDAMDTDTDDAPQTGITFGTRQVEADDSLPEGDADAIPVGEAEALHVLPAPDHRQEMDEAIRRGD